MNLNPNAGPVFNVDRHAAIAGEGQRAEGVHAVLCAFERHFTVSVLNGTQVICPHPLHFSAGGGAG